MTHSQIEQACKDYWKQLASKYMPQSSVLHIWQTIHEYHTQAHRHYHTLEHLHELLLLASNYQQHIQQTDTLQFAIWFHDIIYQPNSKKNEASSAQLAHELLHQQNISTNQLQYIQDFIVATAQHQTKSTNTDLFFFLDFDLAILASPPQRYHLYTQQVRAEYKHIPSFLYQRGRKKVLQHFLHMPRIFKTDVLHNQLEQQARTNILQELQNL